MDCPKCQFENRAGAKFCKKCGNRLELLCPSCGRNYDPDSVFCDECGHNLREPSETPPIDFSQPQSYTPKHLADKILTTRNAIEGERKLVTVLFADAANYTAMSENLDPEEVHQIMDGCFRTLIDQVHRYEGTINQFTGDGIMALFGAPIAHEDHAQRACLTGLAIQEAVANYSKDLQKSHGIDFNMRVGLNSGLVIVGAIGDDLRMDYTAVGDTTNLASRMESVATPGDVLVSVNTHRLARDFFKFDSLGKIEIKGKKEPEEAFRLIKTGDVTTRIGASVAKGLTRFVGRKNSMPALLNAFDKVKSGSGQVVGLVGEAGVGKSRLLLEMRNRLPQGEYNYIEGHCLHYGGSMAYLPALDILRSYFDVKEGDREFHIKKKMEEKILSLDEKLKSVIAPFQSLLSLKVDDEEFTNLEPEKKRERIFEALRDMLIRGSQERPLILVIEDIHWIDKTSEEFIDYMIGWLANTPILLILLYRPEYTHTWGSKSYYTKIGLDQLGMNSSSDMIQAILEEGDVAPELRQLILNRAAGNPLFMEELTHSLLENGSIQRKDERFVLSREPSDIQVPDTIQGIIAARMDRLEDSLKRTMQVASVIGRDFAFRILKAITNMRKELKACLLNLQGLEFIYEKNLFPELEYIFKHAFTQEVAYNSLLLKRRKEIHEKIGQAIEEIYADRLEEFYEMLAYHYSRSENMQKAADYSKLSGIKAVQKYSPIEAFQYYQEALKALKQLPDSMKNKKAQIEVCLLSYVPAVTMDLPDDSFQMFQEAKKISKDIGDHRSLAHFYSFICIFYWLRADSTQAIKYGEKGFEIAKRTQDISVIAPLSLDLSLAYHGQGLYLKTGNIVTDVLNLLEEEEKCFDFFFRAIAIYPALCSFYGFTLGMLGNLDKGEIFCKTGLKTSTKIGELRTLVFSEFFSGFFYCIKGDGKLIIEHINSFIKYSEESKWYNFLGWGFGSLGYGNYLLGDQEKALNNIKKGIKILQDGGLRFALSYLYCFLSMPYFDIGEYEKALESINEALKLAKENNEKHWKGLSMILLGKILLKTDPNKIDTAVKSILKGISITEEMHLIPYSSMGYLYLGELYTEICQKEKALENLKKADRMFQEMGMDYWLARTRKISACL